MYLRLIDKNKFVSPILYIHGDEEEFMGEVKRWKENLMQWIENNPEMNRTPLGRLDAGVCMIDLIRHLSKYYIETSPHCKGKVIATLKLDEYPKFRSERTEDMVDVVEIKTYEIN